MDDALAHAGDNAEAGPSRLTSTPTSTHTPPATPSKMKRRSWFGFASPSALLIPAAPSPKASGRRSSKGAASGTEGALEEMLEMTEAGPSSRRFSLDTTPRPSGNKVDDGAVEVLTIDGETETTVKKKKGRRRSMKGRDEGEAVMMADLSGRQSLDASGKPHDTREDILPPLVSHLWVRGPDTSPSRSHCVHSVARQATAILSLRLRQRVYPATHRHRSCPPRYTMRGTQIHPRAIPPRAPPPTGRCPLFRTIAKRSPTYLMTLS